MAGENIQEKFAKLVHDLCQHRMHHLDTMLLHAILGITSESGEISDLLKKHMFYDKPWDKLVLKEELSDLLHYIQMCTEAIGSSLEEIMAINVVKLTTRYPEGYTKEKALVRDKQAERIAMEIMEKEI